MLFDLDGIDLWVHREILEEAGNGRLLKFWFEPLEWCRVQLAPPVDGAMNSRWNG